MTTAITKITNEFEGCEITTLTYRGKPAWIAREIGEAIGYGEGGKRLTRNLTGDWSEEFVEGHDYTLLSGIELADFRAVFKGADFAPLKSNRGTILLFESGLYLALAKTNKPVGKRLRRFLAEEVLPQIARDGSYIPSRSVEDGKLESDRRLAMAEAREKRLNAQLKSKALKDLVKTLRATGKYDADVLATYEVAAAEYATGENLAALKPATEHWASPSEIAGKLGVTAQRVGRTITKLGLRGNIEGFARAIVNKAAGHQRTVTSYVYSPKAVQQIADELADGGLCPLGLA
jgi:prophage antirepressor-like protein